jgi:hypothetical protein
LEKCKSIYECKDLSDEECAITIYDSLGYSVMEKKVKLKKAKIDVKLLRKGIYTIVIRGSGKSKIAGKFIK